MKLLDLFCGAGGAGMGYYRAGFEVVGVDIAPQPHYPFEFYREDAFRFCAEHGKGFDVIHASPPCQAYSVLTPVLKKRDHPDYIDRVRNMLQFIGRPYIIENVAGAKDWLRYPLLLCGSMFGLGVWRHRLFELSFTCGLVWPCNHDTVPVLVSGTPRRKGIIRKDATALEKREAMGIDWMTTRELDQAIPPAYTEFIGKSLLDSV